MPVHLIYRLVEFYSTEPVFHFSSESIFLDHRKGVHQISPYFSCTITINNHIVFDSYLIGNGLPFYVLPTFNSCVTRFLCKFRYSPLFLIEIAPGILSSVYKICILLGKIPLFSAICRIDKN